MNVYILTNHLRHHYSQSKAVLNFVKGLEKINILGIMFKRYSTKVLLK